MQAEVKTDVPGELLRLRDSIDLIDEELLSVLLRRFEVTAKVGQLKAAHELESVDPKREQEKHQRLRLLAEAKGLNSEFVQGLFQYIFEEVVKNHRSMRKPPADGA